MMLTPLLDELHADPYWRSIHPREDKESQRRFAGFVEEWLGADGAEALSESGLLDEIQDSQEGVGGRYDSSELRASFDVNQIKTKEEAIGAVLHEVGGHHGIENMVKKTTSLKGWDNFRKMVRTAAAKDADIREALDFVVQNYVEGERARADLAELKGKSTDEMFENDVFLHEVVSRMADYAAKNRKGKMGQALSWLRDKVVAFLRTIGVNVRLNAGELARLLEGSVKNVIRTKNVGINPERLHAANMEYMMKHGVSTAENEGMLDRKLEKPVEKTKKVETVPSYTKNRTVEMPKLSGKEKTTGDKAIREEVDLDDFGNNSRPEFEGERASDFVDYSELEPAERLAKLKERVSARRAAEREQGEVARKVHGSKSIESPAQVQREPKPLAPRASTQEEAPGEMEPVVPHAIKSGKQVKFFDNKEDIEPIRTHFPERSKEYPVSKQSEEDADIAPRDAVPSAEAPLADFRGTAIMVPSRVNQAKGQLAPAEGAAPVPPVVKAERTEQELSAEARDAELLRRLEMVKEVAGDMVPQLELGAQILRMGRDRAFSREGEISDEMRQALVYDAGYRQKVGDAIVVALKAGTKKDADQDAVSAAVGLVASADFGGFLRSSGDALVGAWWNIGGGKGIDHTATIFSKLSDIRQAVYNLRDAIGEEMLPEDFLESVRVFEQEYKMLRSVVESAPADEIMRNVQIVAASRHKSILKSVEGSGENVVEVAPKAGFLNFTSPGEWYLHSLQVALENIDTERNTIQKDLSPGAKTLLAHMQATIQAQSIFKGRLSDDAAATQEEIADMLIASARVDTISQGLVTKDEAENLTHAFRPLRKRDESEGDLPSFVQLGLEKLREVYKLIGQVRSKIMPVGATGLFPDGARNYASKGKGLIIKLDRHFGDLIEEAYGYALDNLITPVANNNPRIDIGDFRITDELNSLGSMVKREHGESVQRLTSAIESLGMKVPDVAFPLIPERLVDGKRVSYLDVLLDRFHQFKEKFEAAEKEIDQSESLTPERQDELEKITREDSLYRLSDDEFIVGVVGVGLQYGHDNMRFVYKDMSQELFDKLRAAGMAAVITDEQFIKAANVPVDQRELPLHKQRALWRGLSTFHPSNAIHDIATTPLFARLAYNENARQAVFLNHNLAPMDFGRASDEQFLDLRALTPGAILYENGSFYIVADRFDGKTVSYYELDGNPTAKDGVVVNKFKLTERPLADMKGVRVVPRVWDMLSAHVKREDGKSVLRAFDDYDIYDMVRTAKAKRDLQAISERNGTPVQTSTFAHTVRDAGGREVLYTSSVGGSFGIFKVVDKIEYNPETMTEEEALRLISKAVAESIPDSLRSIRPFADGTLDIDSLLTSALAYSKEAILAAQQQYSIPEAMIDRYMNLRFSIMAAYMGVDSLGNLTADKIQRVAERLYKDEVGTGRDRISAANIVVGALSKGGVIGSVRNELLTEEIDNATRIGFEIDQALVERKALHREDNEGFDDGDEMSGTSGYMIESQDALASGVSDAAVDELIKLPYTFEPDFSGLERMKEVNDLAIAENREKLRFFHDTISKLKEYMAGLSLEGAVASENKRNIEKASKLVHRAEAAIKKLEKEQEALAKIHQGISSGRFREEMEESQRKDWEEASARRESIVRRVKSAYLDGILFSAMKNEAGRMIFSWPLMENLDPLSKSAFKSLSEMVDNDLTEPESFKSAIFDDQKRKLRVRKLMLSDIESEIFSEDSPLGAYLSRFILSAMAMAPASHLEYMGLRRNMVRVALADSLQTLPVPVEGRGLVPYNELSPIDKKAVERILSQAWWYQTLLAEQTDGNPNLRNAFDAWVRKDTTVSVTDKHGNTEQLDVKGVDEVIRRLGYFGSKFEPSIDRYPGELFGSDTDVFFYEGMKLNPLGLPYTHQLEAEYLSLFVASGYIHPAYATVATGRNVQESKFDIASFAEKLVVARRMASKQIRLAKDAKTIDEVPGMQAKVGESRAVSTIYVDEEAFGEAIRAEVAERFLERCLKIDENNDPDGLRSMAAHAKELVERGEVYKAKSGKTGKSWGTKVYSTRDALYLAVEKAFAGYEYLQADLLGIAQRMEEQGLGQSQVAFGRYEVGKPLENVEDVSSFVSLDGTQYVKMSLADMADGDLPHLSKYGDAPTTADKKLMEIMEYVIPGYFGKIEKGGAKTNPNYTTETKVDGDTILFVDDVFVTEFGHGIIDRLRRLHDIALHNERALGHEIARRIRNVWDNYIAKQYGHRVASDIREKQRRDDMAPFRTRVRPTGTPYHELKADVDTAALEQLAQEIVSEFDVVKNGQPVQIIVHQRGVDGTSETMMRSMNAADDYILVARGGDLARTRKEMYGFVDKKGVIHIFAGAHAAEDGTFDRHEFMKTVLHEVIGHKGLKALLGDKFDAFMLSVFEKHVNIWGEVSLTNDQKIALAEEYMAGLVENIRYNEAAGRMTNANIGTLFDRLLSMVMRALRAIAAKVGIKLEISSFEVRELIARGFAGSEIGGRTGMSKLFNPALIPGENLPQYASFGGWEMNWIDSMMTRLTDMLRPWQALERSKTSFGKRLDQPILDALHAMEISGRERPGLRARLESAMMNFMPSMRTLRSRVAERIRRAKTLEQRYIESFAGMDYDSGDVSYLAQAIHTVERMNEAKRRGAEGIMARVNGTSDKKPLTLAQAAARIAKLNARVEKNSKYSGLSLEQAEAVIQQAISGGMISRAEDGTFSGPATKQLELLHQASRQAMLESVRAGLIHKDDYKEWLKHYKYYVTIPATAKYGFLSASSGLAASGAGRFNKAMEAMLGNYIPADVAGATFAGLRMRIVEAEVNKTHQTIFNFALFNPNRDIFRLTVPQSSVDLLVAAGKIPNSKTAIQDYLLEHGMEVMPESTMKMSMAKLKEYELRNGLMPVYIEGELCHVKIVHKALNRAFNLHMHPGRPGRYMQALAKINRWLINCATMLSPEFWIANQPRDASMAYLMLSSRGVIGGKNGTEFAKDFGKRVYKAMRFIWMMNFGKDVSKLGPEYDAFRKYYDNFALSGGKIQWMVQTGSTETMRQIDKGVRLVRGTATRGEALSAKATGFLETMRSISDAFENSTRLAIFVTAMENGISQDEAALMARETTVDFDRKGEMGQFINTLWMFANAGIQANMNMARTLIKNPKQAAKVLGSVVTFSFSLAMMNFIAGGDGDDGEPTYDGISQEVRNGHIVIMVPGSGKAIKIPFAYGFGFYWALGQELASVVMGRRSAGQATAGALASMMNNFNPLETAAGLGDAHGWARMVSPTITDPFVDLYHEQTPFGTPLMPDKAYEAQPDSQRHWRSVSTLSKAVAQSLNAATGGSAAESGLIDVSPESLDLAFEAATGGLGKFLMRTMGMLVSPLTGKEVGLNDIPGIRRLTASEQTWVDRGRFKTNYEEISGVWATLRSLNTSVSAAQDPLLKQAAIRDRDDFVRENQHILSMRKLANNVYHQAKQVDVQKERLYKSGLPASEVTARMRPLNERQKTIYSNFNRRYFEVVDQH